MTKLAELQTRLCPSGALASKAIKALGKRVEWLESNDNWFVRILNPFVFYTPHCVLAVDVWRERHGPAIREWLAVTGEVEALSSLAVYAWEHPTDIFPQMIEGAPEHFSQGFVSLRQCVCLALFNCVPDLHGVFARAAAPLFRSLPQLITCDSYAAVHFTTGLPHH